MENNIKINEILKNHEQRISALEGDLVKTNVAKVVKDKKPLSDHVLALRSTGFFSSPRTAEETHKKLMRKYPCEPDRVSMALLRLADKRLLRKASKVIDRKKYKAYTW